MKHLIIISLAFLCFSAKAQEKPLLTGEPLHYEGIIKTDSTLKENELYTMGKYWFANTYRDSKAVLQTQDATNLILIGRAEFSFYIGGTSIFYPAASKHIAYMIKLQFKDGRLKYELYNFNEDAFGGYRLTEGEPTYTGPGNKIAKRYYEDVKKQISMNAEALKNSIITGFTKQYSITVSKNNW